MVYPPWLTHLDIVESTDRTGTSRHQANCPVDERPVNHAVIQQTKILDIHLFKLPAIEMVSAIVDGVDGGLMIRASGAIGILRVGDNTGGLVCLVARITNDRALVLLNGSIKLVLCRLETAACSHEPNDKGHTPLHDFIHVQRHAGSIGTINRPQQLIEHLKELVSSSLGSTALREVYSTAADLVLRTHTEDTAIINTVFESYE